MPSSITDTPPPYSLYDPNPPPPYVISTQNPLPSCREVASVDYICVATNYDDSLLRFISYDDGDAVVQFGDDIFTVENGFEYSVVRDSDDCVGGDCSYCRDAIRHNTYITIYRRLPGQFYCDDDDILGVFKLNNIRALDLVRGESCDILYDILML